MQRGIIDEKEYIPVIETVEILEYGISVVIDLRGICSYEEFEKQLDFIKTVFKAYRVEFSLIEGDCNLMIYTELLDIKNFYKVNLDSYTLLLGYNYNGNITVDMRKTPHLLIIGLSGQGKTFMAKSIIKNLEDLTDIVLINAFEDDFNGHKGRRIVEEENILIFLKSLLEVKIKRNKPMYIVIDELLSLIKNKEINKCIMQLLAVARHFNVFIIGISQDGTKENLKFKNLFNARVCFRMIEDSSYKTVLGCNVEDQLQKQEFYLYSDGLYKGRTFQV